MPLKAVSPKIVKPAKPKFLISGKSGVGKTMFALSFEKPYYIDTEGGALREQYMKKLVDAGGSYFGKEQGSQDFKIIISEIKELATTKHPFKTLVIDSFSKLYNVARAAAEEVIGSDYARDKKEANKPTRQLIRWLDKIDMTCILICHQADKWERHGKDVVYVGTTFDGFDKLEYELDLWLEVLKAGKDRMFIVRKSRVQSFPEGAEHPLDYKKFSELYGKEVVEAEPTPLIMATQEQVAEMKRLVELVRLDEETIDKWLTKAGAEDWSEMSEEQLAKCLTFIKAKIEPAKEPK